MWQEYLRLREKYVRQAESQNEAYREYLRDHFLYEIYQLGGQQLPEEQFQQIIHTGRRPHEPDELRAYDLWQAWKYTKEQTEKHTPFTSQLVQHIAAHIMKHTGGETTTTVGRYDSSLGDFRLGEDYIAVYSIADYRKIPVLLENLCQETRVQLENPHVTGILKAAVKYLYEFAHIKPFGAGNIETGLISVNYLFIYHRYPLLFLYSEDKAAALNALKSQDMNHIPEEFEEFVVRQQIKFFQEETE